MNTFSLEKPLSSVFWTSKTDKRFHEGMLVAFGVLLLFISAKLSIPLKPIPVTFQTMAVLFIGMTYGWRLGLTTVGVYLLLGALGLPVFAEYNGGLSVFYGPTGGYLVGFLPTVLLSGYLLEHGWGEHFASAAIVATLGTLVTSFSGFMVLMNFVGWYKALLLGVAPFWVYNIFKIFILALIIPMFWRASENSSQKAAS